MNDQFSYEKGIEDLVNLWTGFEPWQKFLVAVLLTAAISLTFLQRYLAWKETDDSIVNLVNPLISYEKKRSLKENAKAIIISFSLFIVVVIGGSYLYASLNI